MFSFIKNQLKKIYYQISGKFTELFARTSIDVQTLHELELILIGADTGVKTTKIIIGNLKKKIPVLFHGRELRHALADELFKCINQPAPIESNVYLLVGINGSGKTTCAAKLAYMLKKRGKKVLLIAADTFRAAATEQLFDWAQKIDSEIVMGKQGQDPASVVFSGLQKYKREQFDAVIIDTAGRLQTKINLMKELEKIKRSIAHHAPDQRINTFLTIDAMLGQNSLEQAQLFHESTQVSGIILTKMDGTGKGGIVFAIGHELKIPVVYISYGEHLDQLKPFDGTSYIQELLQAE